MTTVASAAPVTDIELSITGMTCASCANSIERTLNKLDGVKAQEPETDQLTDMLETWGAAAPESGSDMSGMGHGGSGGMMQTGMPGMMTKASAQKIVDDQRAEISTMENLLRTS